ncbi:unnamed protein product [Rhodiola kirilowii]
MLDSLRRLDRKLLDASAGGNLMDLSPAGVRRKIMAVAEMMQQVIRRQPVQVKPCGFCAATNHKIDECPTIVEDDQVEINAVGDYQNYGNRAGPVRQYGTTTTNQGANGQPWRIDNHHHAQREPYQQNAPNQHQQRGPNSNQAGPSNHGPNKTWEDAVKELAASTQQLANTVHQNQVKTDEAIADLSRQMSQIATTVSELKNDAGRLPSQTIQNPRGNVSMVEVVDMDAAPKESAYWENEMLNTMARISEEKPRSDYLWASEVFNPPAPEGEQAETDTVLTVGLSEKIPVLEAENPNTHGSSCYVQVITPEGNTTHKDELEDRLEARPKQNGPIMEHPLVTSHESSGKSKDPGAFTVTCGIGEAQIHHCLIDLGAAINVMPYSLYCSLKLGPLKPPRLSIELGNKSCVRPASLLEDLTLRVGDLVVPADFYVLQMGGARNDEPPALILGRPFLHTTKTKIDMCIGLLSLAFGGKTSDFYVYEDADRPCTRKPPDIVNTSDLGALILDQYEEIVHAKGPPAVAKKSSPSQGYVKANPPDRWRV